MLYIKNKDLLWEKKIRNRTKTIVNLCNPSAQNTKENIQIYKNL